MSNQQSGFTLIELVVVIVILGILAAVAVPRFINLTDDAVAASCQGVQGAVLSTAVLNIADPNVGGGSGQAGSAQDAVDNTTIGGGVTLTNNGGTIESSVDGNDCPDFTIPADLIN